MQFNYPVYKSSQVYMLHTYYSSLSELLCTQCIFALNFYIKKTFASGSMCYFYNYVHSNCILTCIPLIKMVIMSMIKDSYI